MVSVNIRVRLPPYLNRMTVMFLLRKTTWIYSARQQDKPALSLGRTLNLLPWKSACVGSAEVRGAWQTNGLGAGLEDARVNKLHKQVLEEVIACFPLIHRPHRNRRVQQFIYCCVSIRCCDNGFTEPLPSNEWRDTHTGSLMGGIYEASGWDGLRCHDIHTKFHKAWFRHSKVKGERGDSPFLELRLKRSIFLIHFKKI
jgi:hypothetical protein